MSEWWTPEVSVAPRRRSADLQQPRILTFQNTTRRNTLMRLITIAVAGALILLGASMLLASPAMAQMVKCPQADGTVISVPAGGGVTCGPTFYHNGPTAAQEAQKRIDAANHALSQIPKEVKPQPMPRQQGSEPRVIVEHCIAGSLKRMTSPGHWEDIPSGCAGRRDPGEWTAR